MQRILESERAARREMSRMKNEPRITEGSDNVYADLRLPDPDVALAKANLAIRIKQSIEEQHLTQIQAAKLLGVDQARVSALVCGPLSGFSTDRLFCFLNALGRDVETIVRPESKFRKQGHVSVAAP